MALILSVGLALCFAPGAHAQGPAPQDAADKASVIVQLALDLLQGQPTLGADALFAQAKQAAANLAGTPEADLFLLDFGNPNLPLNQFATTLARNLLALTPLYVIAYVALLVYAIWKERPIPNPFVYAALVAGVMVFLATFALITQGMSELGRGIAATFGGGAALFARATLFDTLIRILVTLQKNGGGLAVVALLVSIGLAFILLIQLAYRGITLALWRLVGVLLVPLSVLLEGVQPKTAGKVLAGFFEAWLDFVGKLTVALIALGLASADALANYVWLVLPAGLLAAVFSWTYFGLLFRLLRDAGARAWRNLTPASAADVPIPMPPAAEAARAQEIDAARREIVEE